MSYRNRSLDRHAFSHSVLIAACVREVTQPLPAPAVTTRLAPRAPRSHTMDLLRHYLCGMPLL